MREEDKRRDEWDLLPPEGALAREQRLQTLRLAVREQHRVVVAALAGLTGRHALPCPGITANDSRPALDLNEEDALRADDEDIDLADGSVEDELEVGPRAVGLVIRQALLEERERIALPWEVRRGDLDPAPVHACLGPCLC